MVEIDPIVHLAQFDIAYNVVNRGQSCRFGAVVDGLISRGEGTIVVTAINEDMEHLSIGADRGGTKNTVLVFFLARLPGTDSTA